MPQFTHVDRVMFPEVGVTKGDLLDYYSKIAPKLLPHLRDRPMTLERMPEGVGAGAKSLHFWQKNTPSYYPKSIPRIELKTDAGKPVQYVLVNDKDALLYLVNQGTITFHPFLSRVGSLDTPDYVLFDVDPHQSTFGDAVKVAKALHEALQARKVESFVKTTGKSGLHVLTPWKKSGGGYDEARAWATKVAEEVVGELPGVATMERVIENRRGKVYLDVIQNARAHHAVPPYVVRATPTATVSMPVEWGKLNARLNPSKFTVKTVPGLVGKGDPMKSLVGGRR